MMVLNIIVGCMLKMVNIWCVLKNCMIIMNLNVI